MAEQTGFEKVANPRLPVSVDIQQDITNNQALAKVFVDSGLAIAPKSQAQAMVFIWAGRELGLQPFESMNAFDIIEGKVAARANTRAAQVKRSGRYNYRVIEHDDDHCLLHWFENISGTWEKIGESAFTMDEARRARLAGKQNWTGYQRDMLFNRAISRGQRQHCPEVMGGAVFYDKDEILDMNEDGEVEPTALDSLRDKVQAKLKGEPVEEIQEAQFREEPEPATPKPKGRKAAPAPVAAPVEPDPYEVPEPAAEAAEPQASQETGPQVVDLEEAKRIKAARAQREEDDRARALKNFEDNIAANEASKAEIRAEVEAEKQAEVVTFDAIVRSHGGKDMDVIRLKRIKDWPDSDTVDEVCAMLVEKYGSLGNALVSYVASVKGVEPTFATMTGFLNAPIDGERATEVLTPSQAAVNAQAPLNPPVENLPMQISRALEPFEANTADVIEWLSLNEIHPDVVTDFCEHLQGQGSNVSAVLREYAMSGSFDDAAEAAGFGVA